jgi:hypothetical protein
MNIFDLRTTGRPGLRRAPPPGYNVGWVRIGDLDETVFFSTKIWSSSDYARHWKATAELLLREGKGLFCTDLTDDNASIFIGFPIEGGYDFEEWVIPRNQFELVGLELRIASADRSEGASCWRVSEEAVRAFTAA